MLETDSKEWCVVTPIKHSVMSWSYYQGYLWGLANWKPVVLGLTGKVTHIERQTESFGAVFFVTGFVLHAGLFLRRLAFGVGFSLFSWCMVPTIPSLVLRQIKTLIIFSVWCHIVIWLLCYIVYLVFLSLLLNRFLITPSLFFSGRWTSKSISVGVWVSCILQMEAPVLFNVYGTVQEGLTIAADILSCELETALI